MILIGLGVSACAASDTEPTSTVRFAGSNEPVASAVITPLVGFAPEAGTVAIFAIDPNNESTTSDSSGNFSLDIEVPAEVPGVQVSVEVPSAIGPAIGRLDWRSAVDAEAANTQLEIAEPTPCADNDCLAPLLPDLVPIIGWSDVSPEAAQRLEPTTIGPTDAGLLPSETWFTTTEDGRRLLRFATIAANLGDGPLDIIAGEGNADGAATWQRLWTASWTFEDHLSGEFLYHPTHDHIHFDAFERYRLIAPNGDIVAASEKVSFCLRDSVRIVDDPPAATGGLLHDDGQCMGNQQVINAGFGDHYHALLDDQWIDITDVPPGDYQVEIAVDPLNLIIESDETNNIGIFPVVID